MDRNHIMTTKSRPTILFIAAVIFCLNGCLPTTTETLTTMPQNKSELSEESSNWLQVLTDSHEIRLAGEVALKTQQSRFEDIFRSLADPWFLDSDSMAMLMSRRTESIERLRALLASNSVNDEGIGAALILCRLREADGRKYIRQVLEIESIERRQRVLGVIDGIVLDGEEEELYREFIFADGDLVSILLGQLRDPDARIVKSAIQCCGYLRVPGATECFIKLLETPNVPDSGRVLFWLSKGELTEDLFKVASKSFDPTKFAGNWGSTIFQEFARKSSEPLKSNAKKILLEILNAWPDEGKGLSYGQRQNVITTLSETAEEGDLNWIRELAQKEKGLYGVAPLVAWIRLDPKEGKEVLVSWLQTAERRHTAAQAASQAFQGTADAELDEHLAKAAEKSHGRDLLAICSALNSIGGASANTVIQNSATQLEAADLARLRQAANVIPLNDLALAVEEAGILTREELKVANEKLTTSQRQEMNNSPGLFELLVAAESALAFDAETGVLPCRHDNLIAEFAKASRGKFLPESLNEEWHRKNDSQFDAPYTVQFVSDGRLYRSEIRNLSDWYDVERVVLVINTALADSRVKERFIGLESDGQVAMFVFAEPARIMPIANRYNMPISSDINRAMKNGIEFEEYVRGRLHKK